MYLLDTDVLAELRRPRPHGGVQAWLAAVRPARLCLSVVTLGEIQSCVEQARAQDAEKFRKLLAWTNEVERVFEILPIDAPVIRAWAGLAQNRPDDSFEDAILAVTANLHGLTLVTRNAQHHLGSGVAMVNPFLFPAAKRRA